jgi:hypothetical protein
MIGVSERLDSSLVDQRIRIAAIEMFLSSVRRSLPDLPPARELESVPDEVSLLLGALEESLVPNPSDERELFRRYLDVVRAAARLGPVLDLDSRGQGWLRFMKDEGISAYGVTSNKRKIEESLIDGCVCRDEGVLQHLREVPPGTLGAIYVSGLFDRVRLDETIEILDLSVRALSTGGVLIVEGLDSDVVTKSPALVFVQSGNKLPMPSSVLSYLLEARGFVGLEKLSGASASERVNSETSGLAALRFALIVHRP